MGKYVIKIITIVAASFFMLLSNAQSEEVREIQLYVGAVKTIQVGTVERIAVGAESILSTTILDTGDVLLIPKEPGVTDIQIWKPGNRLVKYRVTVSFFDPEQQLKVIQSLITDFNGVTVSEKDGTIILQGETPESDVIRLEELMERFPEVINLVTGQKYDLLTVLARFPNTELITEGSMQYVIGEVNDGDFKSFESMMGNHFSDVISLVKPVKVLENYLVTIDLKLLEVNQQFTRNTGIKWLELIDGPTYSTADAYITNPNFRTAGANTRNSIVEEILDTVGVEDGRGYASFGLITTLSSTIQLMEQDGLGRILAEPRLTTRSGGHAEFLAGGEFPVAVLNQFGQPIVEFRDYGISLEISPIADADGNILVDISTTVSTIDFGNIVQGVPGLLKREVESVLSVKSGQTIVMSGLVSSADSETNDKVPYLGNIPLLGRLFTSKNVQRQKTELIVLVTPRVNYKEKVSEQITTHLDELINLFGESTIDQGIAE